MAAERAEQILQHMDQLYSDRKTSIKADSYSYNTVLNAWAKSGQVGAPQRAERILTIMENKFRNGDKTLKPNTRTYTTVSKQRNEPYSLRKWQYIQSSHIVAKMYRSLILGQNPMNETLQRKQRRF